MGVFCRSCLFKKHLNKGDKGQHIKCSKRVVNLLDFWVDYHQKYAWELLGPLKWQITKNKRDENVFAGLGNEWARTYDWNPNGKSKWHCNGLWVISFPYRSGLRGFVACFNHFPSLQTVTIGLLWCRHSYQFQTEKGLIVKMQVGILSVDQRQK